MTSLVTPDTAVSDPLAALVLNVLDRHGEMTVALSNQLAGNCGVVDRDNAVILLNQATSPGKRRATLVHELLHLCFPDLDDDCIEAATADVLISVADASDALCGAATITEIADRAGVDPQLVRTRIAGLCDHLQAS